MVLGKLAELQERVTESQVSRIEAIMEANENNDLDVVIGNLSLSKNNLAASLGVSRTKIDSAIEQLTKDGIEEFQDIAKVGLRFALTPWHCHMISDKLGIKTWNDVHPEKEIIAISNLKGGTGKREKCKTVKHLVFPKLLEDVKNFHLMLIYIYLLSTLSLNRFTFNYN